MKSAMETTTWTIGIVSLLSFTIIVLFEKQRTNREPTGYYHGRRLNAGDDFRSQKAPRIPHILWFTYGHNILLSGEPKEFYDNVVNTVELYHEAWDDPDATLYFLKDELCEKEISLAAPTLLPYFEIEPRGDFKSDMCRAAVLYRQGGFYFDIDVEVVKPFIPPDDIAFTAATSHHNSFHQGFMGSEAGHPLLKESLIAMIAAYEENRAELLWSGPSILTSAYERLGDRQHNVMSTTYVLEESLLDSKTHPEVEPQIGVGTCNYVILDPRTATVHFFTRFLGSPKCQPHELAPATPIPRALWFAHKQSNILETTNLSDSYPNVLQTIDSYRKAWNDQDVPAVFLGNGSCHEEISTAEPELLPYFEADEYDDEKHEGSGEEGKIDMCKISVLYNHGGYFFDVDLKVVGGEPLLADEDDSFSFDFATTRGSNGLLFQHFVASGPHNPILKLALKKLLHGYQYGLDPSSLMGTTTIETAYSGKTDFKRGKSKILEVRHGERDETSDNKWDCLDVIHDGEAGRNYFAVRSNNVERCI